MMQSKIYGDRIRQARHLRKLLSKDMAVAMKWSPVRASRNEQSESLLVTDGELEGLSRLLRFPVNFFLMEPAPEIAPPGLLYRAPKRTTLRERDFLEEFGRFVAEAAELLNEQYRLPGVVLPTIPIGTEPEDAAHLVRAALKLAPKEPVGYLTHLVETAGVPVVVRLGESDLTDLEQDGPVDNPEQHSGCSAWFGEFAERPIVMMRSRQSWDRTRLTLAHELGHIVLHRRGVTADAEEEAFRFAVELLAPISGVMADLPQYPTLSNLYPVKMKWGISIGALIRHLHRSGVFTQEQFRRLQAQMYSRINPETGSTWGLTEPGWNDRTPETPRMLAKWFEVCYGTRSPQVIAATVGLWPVDLLTQMLRSQRSGAPAASQTPEPATTTPQSKRRAGLVGGPATLSLADQPSLGDIVDFSAARRARRG